MADRAVVVPLTPYQREVLALLAQTRTPDSYLAGGAALHIAPNSIRYSHDLDFFHDSAERVASAYSADSNLLEDAGHDVQVEVWAAVGKDPGFSPLSLLELLKRRGRVQPQAVARLDLVRPYDPVASKQTWLAALEATEEFARTRPAEEAGCLYYSTSRKRFVLPEPDVPLADQGVAPHWGRPGGILPRAVES